MEERRAYERHTLPMTAKTKYYVKGKPLEESLNISNIGRGGLCLCHESEIEVGSIMDIEICDCDSGFVNQLGEWEKVHGDLVNLKVQGEVIRNDAPTKENNHHHVAVRFNSPIHILGY